MKFYHHIFIIVSLFLFSTCKMNSSKAEFTGEDGEMKLIVLDPGHFHAALLQKNPLSQVNDTIYVYAPSGKELEQYIATIESFNNRAENPTSWKLIVYEREDFLDAAITEKKGNIVVLAGNNKYKAAYIAEAIGAGLNVLSDKPMAINQKDFQLLIDSYDQAKRKKVLLYDLMTERYDILNVIEKELMHHEALFGNLQKGSLDEPAISMESVHHFYKEVAGNPLIRPVWYYDVEQQGEGIADVTTHLIDLVNWKCFPEEIVDYQHEVAVLRAENWPTEISLQDYQASTLAENFPPYLQKYVEDNVLKVNANGVINYQVKEVNVALKVIWNYQAPQGGGDTFSSLIRGTKANLLTLQNQEQNFKKQLYIQPAEGVNKEDFLTHLASAIQTIQHAYPFVSWKEVNGKYLIDIPLEDRLEHEVHFGYVAKKYFSYLINKNMPEWEDANTLAKYYVTTQAVKMANQ